MVFVWGDAKSVYTRAWHCNLTGVQTLSHTQISMCMACEVLTIYKIAVILQLNGLVQDCSNSSALAMELL